MADLSDLVQKYSSEVKVSTLNDKVYKDECVYTYDTPESEHGLFICLKSFIGVSKSMLPLHYEKTNSHLYLNLKTRRRQKTDIENIDNDEPDKKKVNKLALGVKGGFDLNEKFFFEHENFLYIFPEEKSIQIFENSTDKLLNDKVLQSITSIINAESATLKEELSNQGGTWDGEKRFISKHSYNLLQLNNPVQISPDPKSWKCELCDVTKNLWLNLTDGAILCGRRQLDGTGGNNHALEHYKKTNYPLAVKLGTITAKGADVYSYDEDDMVDDKNLAIHLVHFGINMSKMEKTEKTMAELEIDLNQRVGEWDRIQEAGSKLIPLYGPGFTGMRNLGNSCYMNSVMQVLFTIPDFIQKYLNNREIYQKYTPIDPSKDFNFQMSKLAYGLLSGNYSYDESSVIDIPILLRRPNGIKPTSFKTLIGRGHVEFSTKRQQDSHEFLIYLFTLIERNLRNDPTYASNLLNPVDSFRFRLQDRIECTRSKHVKYKYREEFCLSLPIAKDCALNKEQVKEFETRKADLALKGLKLEPGDIVRPEIKLEDCFKMFMQDELIDNFYSTAVKEHVKALKSTRLATMPDYLLIQMKKFDYAADWTPIKLDISLQVPDTLDLNEIRGRGIRETEIELEEETDDGNDKTVQIQLNEGIISQLVDMGFSLEGSKRAVFYTKESNDTEAAINWAVSHMEDSDFNNPFILPSCEPRKHINAKNLEKVYNEESINSIISWGFTRQQAMKALDSTDNNLERAADWIFSHTDDLMDLENKDQSNSSEEKIKMESDQNKQIFRDGNANYKLVAFISHMGTNANVGHYVAHILKNEKWTIFNDENVSLSENPPKDLAYLYFYKRI